MKGLFKKTVALAAVLMLVCATGCSDADETPNSYTSYKSAAAGSGTVAENVHYKLLWDNNAKCVLLSDNETGKVWSSVPYEYYKQQSAEGVAKVQLCSPILLEYYETASLQIKSVTGYAESVASGTVLAQKMKNGVKITYYFERLEISVPVEYLLCDDGLEVRLMVNEIGENKNLVTRVSLLPYFASTQSGDSSYLIIPSGDGALMNTDVGRRNIRTYSGAVYGNDYSSSENEKISNEEPVRLPFFGVKSGNDALCVILDRGAETATVNAQAGNDQLGYASVYTTYQIRSYDYVQTQSMHGMTNVIPQYSYSRLDLDYCSARYIPINGKGADYVDMAKTYRDNMIKNTDRDGVSDEPELYLKMYGAAQTTQLILGVPVTRLKTLTTVKQTESIIREVSEKTGCGLAVQLMGYGTSGLNIGKIGGGFKIASVLGGRSELKKMNQSLSEDGIDLFWDFDLIRYSRSGCGVSLYGGSAQTPNGLGLTKYQYLINLFNKDKKTAFKLLSRDRIDGMTQKLSSAAELYGMTGISLKTLSSIAYSDFADTASFLKSGIAAQTSGTFGQLKEDGLRIAADSANAYAAEAADCIFNAPCSSGRKDGFDTEVPLYQIVYKGYIPMSGSAVNLATDARRAFLSAVSTGTGLCFSLVSKRDRELIEEEYNNAISFSDYDSLKDDIYSMSEEAKPLLKAVSGCTISDYSVISDKVRVTEFSNGVSVTVNFGDTDYSTDSGTVAAESFTVSGVAQ